MGLIVSPPKAVTTIPADLNVTNLTATGQVNAPTHNGPAGSSVSVTNVAGVGVSGSTVTGTNLNGTRCNLQCIDNPFSAIAYNANVALPLNSYNNFVIGALTGNITFTFSNPASGKAGLIMVQQDAVGARTVTFTPPAGWTLIRDESIADLTPNIAANKITRYAYLFYTLGATQYLEITKAKMA